MAKATILFADNDYDFLETRSEFLEDEGYAVLKARSPEEARNILDRGRVQLAILDIRLTDDRDGGDISGLELAQEAAYRSIPKIMLTGFPNVEAVRIALRHRIDELPPAVDYISKKGEEGKKGAEVLIEAVERAFASHVRINRDLDIRWGRQDELLPPSLVSLVDPDLPSGWLADRSGELEDLIRKLFYFYSQVTLGRVLTRREGWILLNAFAYPAQGLEQQFAVACGQRVKVAGEKDRHTSFVPQTAGNRSSNLVDSAETVHFEAAAYRLGGCTVGEAMTLVEFYHRQSTDRVVAAVDDLFQVALRPWYEQGQEKQQQPLDAFCWEWLGADENTLARAELEKRVTGICRAALASGIVGLDCSPHKLTFRSPEGTEFFYPQPAPYLYERRITVSPPTLCGITHGRLDGASVLVDRTGQTWVVDFGRTGLGPLVRDFVSLETSVKFDVLTGADIAQRHELESRLLAMCHLGEKIDTEDVGPEVEKALRVIDRIRSQAADIVGPQIDPYLMGLLFCAAERLLRYRPGLRYTKGEAVTFAHILLSMGMMCQRLAAWEDRLQDLPSQATESLWIDVDNQEVWVEGRLVTLSPLGFRLLQYLYDHANQLCKRADIAENVFDVEHSDISAVELKFLDKDQINTNISRLRKAVEPNPNHPKYIVTVHGVGYKLLLGDVAGRDE